MEMNGLNTKHYGYLIVSRIIKFLMERIYQITTQAIVNVTRRIRKCPARPRSHQWSGCTHQAWRYLPAQQKMQRASLQLQNYRKTEQPLYFQIHVEVQNYKFDLKESRVA